MSSPAAHPVFKLGEICVCFQKETPYLAKVIGVEVKDGVEQYTIHYEGWNNRFNEVVPGDSGRVIKGTLEEYQIANNLPIKPSSKYQGRKSRKVESRASSSLGGSDIQEEEEVFTTRRMRLMEPRRVVRDDVVDKKVEIEFSEPLRQILLNDCRMMSTRKTVLRLPDDGSVEDIIARYVDSMEDNLKPSTLYLMPTENVEDINQIIGVYTANAIVNYFNLLLGSHLLYPSERADYRKRVERIGFRASEHYGIVHLLRMLSRFNEYYSYRPRAPGLAKYVETGIKMLMEYLTAHHQEYYLGNDCYELPPDVPSTSRVR